MIQNRIIFFCYIFIVGIITAMLLPLDPIYLPLLEGIWAALFVISMIVLYLHMRHKKKGTGEGTRQFPASWVLLFLVGLLLGYMRYLSANTVPDTRLGFIQLSGDTAEYIAEDDLTDTHRVRLVKQSALGQDVQLELQGELDARIPVKDERGRPFVDEEGRWHFDVAKLPQVSQTIYISANDPLGTSYLVPQPFTRITNVLLKLGPSTGHITLYRVSNHIRSFVRPGRRQTPVTVLGRIVQDPMVYDFKTVIPISPRFIQYLPGGPFYRVAGGDIRVTMKPEIEGYSQFARSEAYGYDVVVKGELFGARTRSNPGGFDQRKFLRNHNI